MTTNRKWQTCFWRVLCVFSAKFCPEIRDPTYTVKAKALPLTNDKYFTASQDVSCRLHFHDKY
jgi:hypothetical protein